MTPAAAEPETRQPIRRKSVRRTSSRRVQQPKNTTQDDDDNDDDINKTSSHRRSDLKRESSLQLQDIFAELSQASDNDDNNNRRNHPQSPNNPKQPAAETAHVSPLRQGPKSAERPRINPIQKDNTAKRNSAGRKGRASARRRIVRGAGERRGSQQSNNMDSNMPRNPSNRSLRSYTGGDNPNNSGNTNLSSNNNNSAGRNSLRSSNNTNTIMDPNESGSTLLSFLSYNNASVSTHNKDTDEISRADLFLEGLRQEQREVAQQQQQQQVPNMLYHKTHNDDEDDTTEHEDDSHLFSSSKIAKHLALHNSKAKNDQEEEEDAATILTTRRKAERDQRRQQMRDRMRRERQAKLQKEEKQRQRKIKQQQQQSQSPAGASSPQHGSLKQRTKEFHQQRQLEKQKEKQQQKLKPQQQKSNKQSSTTLTPTSQHQKQQGYSPRSPPKLTDVYYVSSDAEDEPDFSDDDDDDENAPDDGTVLQFDPTQDSAVYVAKQVHQTDSECEFSDKDGSISKVSISGLEDPISMAQQNSWSTSGTNPTKPPQKPIFDFLEDGNETNHATVVAASENALEFGNSKDDSSDDAETLPTLDNTKLSLDSSNGPRTKKKKKPPPRNNDGSENAARSTQKKGLVGDAQKYAQFLKPRNKKVREKVGDGTVLSADSSTSRPRKAPSNKGKRKPTLGQRLSGQQEQQQQRPLTKSGSSKSLWETNHVDVDDVVVAPSASMPPPPGALSSSSPQKPAQTLGQRRPSHSVKPPSMTQHEVPYPMDDPTTGSISNVETDDEEDEDHSSSLSHNMPTSLTEFLPGAKHAMRANNDNAMTMPHDDDDDDEADQRTFVNPPSVQSGSQSGEHSGGGSLIAPSGGESVSTASPKGKRSHVLSPKKKTSPKQQSRNNNNNNMRPPQLGRGMSENKLVRNEEFASDSGASPMSVRSKIRSKSTGGLASSIGRYFSNRRRSTTANDGDVSNTDNEDDGGITTENEDDDDDDGAGSVASSFSRGLFSSFRASGRGLNQAPILLGDDSSSYESSSANTR